VVVLVERDSWSMEKFTHSELSGFVGFIETALECDGLGILDRLVEGILI
jgi:hypothetical protein